MFRFNTSCDTPEGIRRQDISQEKEGICRASRMLAQFERPNGNFLLIFFQVMTQQHHSLNSYLFAILASVGNARFE